MDLFIQHCQAVIETQGGLLLSLFLGGLLGSISHCTGMCGPIVMAQASARQARGTCRENAGPEVRAPAPSDGSQSVMIAARGALMPYHFGRMASYMMLGVAGASMSQYLIGTPAQKAVAATMLLIAGTLFLAKSVPALQLFSFNKKIQQKAQFFTKPYGRLVGTVAAPFSNGRSWASLFLFGAMLGFLPCGLVMAAVMASASAGDPLTAAFGMAAFSVGTVPSLVAVGMGTGYLRRKWPREVGKVANTVMALNGMILCMVAVRLAL